jgi:carboxypeptidase C (cathepsin A)
MLEEEPRPAGAPPGGTGARTAHGPYEPPPGAEADGRWTGQGARLGYHARAEWIVLRRREKPVAEIFHVSYLAADERRPVTFVFNGGPGASSAYLHMGVAGPRRLAMPADGSLPAMPPRLVDNEDSWLRFTDLVFIDPVGTGLSRVVDPEADGSSERGHAAKGSEPADDDRPDERTQKFLGYRRDLESLCEFISRWLSLHGRWGSPVFIAGESYGGYRVGRLSRMLQETTGIGLNGAILISPALELSSLSPTDYDIVPWIELTPTMALAAVHHGRSRAFEAGTAPELVAREAERFATGPLATLLARGAAMPEAERAEILSELAGLVGLPAELVERSAGRIRVDAFRRELLRDAGRVLGIYDTTVTTVDPFPDRDAFEGPDPTLAGTSAAFTAAINRQLRSEIGLRSEREYMLLSLEVNRGWRDDDPEHFFVPPRGATDDLRYGLALNPHMRAFIAHGRYDLATPYFASERLRDLMRMDPATSSRLTVRHFDGGHMFYAWEQSRQELGAALHEFITESLPAL